MLYEKDFAHLRPHINKLQIFPRNDRNRAERRQVLHNFADDFTLHGFSYAFNKKIYKFERYFWASCVILSIVATIYACIQLSDKYSDKVVVTVVKESQYPVFMVYFPAVAVCTRNRVNWSRLKLAQKKFLSEDADNATIEAFTGLVKLMNSFRFRTFGNIAGIKHTPLHLLDAISITKLAEFMAFRCNEIFYSSCMWAEKTFDCCKMFVKEKTDLGVCWVFNSIVTEESKQISLNNNFYPYRNSKKGEGSGLMFTVKYNDSDVTPGVIDTPPGIEIIFKKPDQWTDHKGYVLRPRTSNAVTIRPETIKASPELKTFSPAIRNCIFQTEKKDFYHIPGLPYRQWNCRSQCIQHHLIQNCNCTLPLFFRKAERKIRECKVSELACIYDNRDIFENVRRPNEELFVRQLGRGMLCDCLSSCNAVNYHMAINMVPSLAEPNMTNATHVDIFYQSEVIPQYLSMFEFTTLDLVSYFGGIVALFLGASIISSCEIGHLLIVELASYIQEWAEKKRVTGNAQPRTH